MTATTRVQELLGDCEVTGTSNGIERNNLRLQQSKKVPAIAHQMLEDIKALLPAEEPTAEQYFRDKEIVGHTTAEMLLNYKTGRNSVLEEVTAVLERYFGEGR